MKYDGIIQLQYNMQCFSLQIWKPLTIRYTDYFLMAKKQTNFQPQGSDMHSDTACMIKAPICGGGKEADHHDLKKIRKYIHQS